MTTLRNLLLGAVSATIAMTVAGAAAAQSKTADATISATIQSPMTIIKKSDMAFGTIIKPVDGSGTVTLAPGGAISSDNADVVVQETGTTAASFTVTSADGTTFTPSASGSLAGVTDFELIDTANPNGTAITLEDTTTHELRYGAKFTVSDQTAVGVKSGTITVTVNYQ